MRVFGIACLVSTAGPAIRYRWAVSVQIATDDQEETERYWHEVSGRTRYTAEMTYLDFLAPPRARRKVFVSFHHKDQGYRNEWDRLTSGIFINKSVYPGDIDTENSAEYIARLIRQDFISDASVVVVLIGPKTYGRKHVDWEIAAALDPRSGGRSGLFGIILPNHPDFGPGKSWSPQNIPLRLADNAYSGYAKIYDWTADLSSLTSCADTAFGDRLALEDKAMNGRLQMSYNMCD